MWHWIQRIKTSGLRAVLFLTTGKGIEELNAKGCNPQHSGKKPKRRNAVTDVEGWGAGKVKNYEKIQYARAYDMSGIKPNNYKPF